MTLAQQRSHGNFSVETLIIEPIIGLSMRHVIKEQRHCLLSAGVVQLIQTYAQIVNWLFGRRKIYLDENGLSAARRESETTLSLLLRRIIAWYIKKI
jgi:hypothetical protein